eukprot:s835_g19.t1
MKCAAALVATLAFWATTGAFGESLQSPVQKVVQMLQAMSSKGKKELQEEKVQYARYAEWCKGTAAEKSKAIEASDSKIEVLTADIGKAATDAEVLGKDIEGHAAAAAELAAQESEATKVREDEAKDFLAEQKERTPIHTKPRKTAASNL